MRSKIGTKTRLAAHILALVLLIVLLVYGGPAATQQPTQHKPLRPSVSIPPRTETAPVAPPVVPTAPVAPVAPAPPADGTLDRIHTPAGAEAASPGELRPPEEAPAIPEVAPEPPEEAQPIEPAPEEPVTPEAEPVPETVAEPSESVAPTEPEEPVETPDEPEPESVKPPASEEPAEPVRPEAPETPAAPEPVAPQPDESGSLVVAASETGVDKPIPAATPLPENANLVVLGDGVYWIDSRYNLEKELSAIPEIGSMVFLAPLPEYHSTGFEHIKTEVIAADLADLSADAAEHYLQVVAGEKHPVVTVVLPGARGAAFFKGAYLLANRKLEMAEIIRELEPELEDADTARDDIIHRLVRLQEHAR